MIVYQQVGSCLFVDSGWIVCSGSAIRVYDSKQYQWKQIANWSLLLSGSFQWTFENCVRLTLLANSQGYSTKASSSRSRHGRWVPSASASSVFVSVSRSYCWDAISNQMHANRACSDLQTHCLVVKLRAVDRIELTDSMNSKQSDSNYFSCSTCHAAVCSHLGEFTSSVFDNAAPSNWPGWCCCSSDYLSFQIDFASESLIRVLRWLIDQS